MPVLFLFTDENTVPKVAGDVSIFPRILRDVFSDTGVPNLRNMLSPAPSP